MSGEANEGRKGKIYLVGMGPGNLDGMTPAAAEAVRRSDVLCGYTLYIDLLESHFPGKEIITTPMRQEILRCQLALQKAEEGKTVAMLCSGDAGIYGMAGPVLSLADGSGTEIEIVPGVTAAISGAALLGAPLMNDFCVISLSDLLTPWETIEKRLRCAGEGDFSIAVYNPRSKKRADHLRRACDILLETRKPDTVCGWVRNIGREGQEAHVTTLSELRDAELDMFSTVFIGSSETRNIGGRMVTPRGYRTGNHDADGAENKDVCGENLSGEDSL